MHVQTAALTIVPPPPPPPLRPCTGIPDSFFIVPQDSYFPHGTLAQQIAYPNDVGPLAAPSAGGDEHARAEATQVRACVRDGQPRRGMWPVPPCSAGCRTPCILDYYVYHAHAHMHMHRTALTDRWWAVESAVSCVLSATGLGRALWPLMCTLTCLLLLLLRTARQLLEAVGLGPWLREHGFDLDSVQDWHSVLSGGQKQRLAWVRLYHHCPSFALIDEGTSAVDRHSVDQLFLFAKKLSITMFTISHHDAVDAHHTRALDLAKGGKWSWSSDVSTPRDSEEEEEEEGEGGPDTADSGLRVVAELSESLQERHPDAMVDPRIVALLDALRSALDKPPSPAGTPNGQAAHSSEVLEG
jgi:hypothetical protein